MYDESIDLGASRIGASRACCLNTHKQSLRDTPGDHVVVRMIAVSPWGELAVPLGWSYRNGGELRVAASVCEHELQQPPSSGGHQCGCSRQYKITGG